MSSFPFPTLGLFSIYTNITQPPSINNNEEEEDKVEEEDSNNNKKSDSELELEKILFFYSNDLNSKKKERKIRLMGTVMGMADFARMLSGGGNAPNVKSVHSLKQRMLWIGPEKGYFIHFTIELPQPVKQNIKDSAVDNQRYKTSMNYLEDEPLLEALSLAYSSYRLHHGTFQGLMEREGKEKLIEQIQSFWSTWLEKWSLQSVIRTGLESVVGGFREYPLASTSRLQLDPLVSQFRASNPFLTPIILHGSKILSLPSMKSSTSNFSDIPDKVVDSSTSIRQPQTLPLTTKDLNSLVEQILSTIPPSPPLPLPSIPLNKKPSRLGNLQSSIMSPSSSSSSIEKSTSTKSESTSSKWNTYTLGMGSYLTSSVNATTNSVSSMKTMVNLPSLAMNSAMNLPISSLSAYIPDAITRRKESGSSIGESVAPVEVAVKPVEDSINIIEDEVAIPTVKVLDLDSLSLTEAINDEETLNSSSISIPTSIEVDEAPTLVQPLHYYCGTGNSKDTSMEVRIYKRGMLTLALASPAIESSSILDNKASKLLEAIESIVQDSPPLNTSTTTSSHRTLIRTESYKSSNNWPTGNDAWSGRNSIEAQEVEGTLFDCYRSLQSEPKILETFIRLNSKHWIFASRHSEAISSERKDVYAVLPSKIGKEGSFIDASEEIRKLLDR